MLLIGGHLQDGMSQEERCKSIGLETPGDAAFHPLAKFGAVTNELREVGAIPGWDVALPRSGVGASQPPAGTVTANAAKLVSALQPA